MRMPIPPRVQPGDTILVHAGLYVGDRFHYMNGAPRPGYLAMGNVFDGTYYLTQSGTPDKPIVDQRRGRRRGDLRRRRLPEPLQPDGRQL